MCIRDSNLADPAAVSELVRGADAIVHLGGVSVERSFEEILPANIQGVYHVYDCLLYTSRCV